MDEPAKYMSPIELQHFQFGISIDFPINKLFLDVGNMAVHNRKFFFKVDMELTFF